MLDAGVDEVGDGLRGGGKNWEAILPPHWKDERERYQLVCVWRSRKGDAQFWDVINIEGDAVEAVADVKLDEINRAKRRVRQENLPQDAIEGMSKLHHVHCSQGKHVGIYIPPAVINYPSRPAITLWNDAQGEDVKTREIFDC